MNTRLFYTLLAVQALFAIGLIVVGFSSREARRVEYLDLTRRITSGQARSDDYARLAERISGGADALAIRTLCGPPMARAQELQAGDAKPQRYTGTFWIYYPADANGFPLDFDAIAKLKGPVQCFVVSFDEKGRGQGELMIVQHPLKQ
jgi:hypothetical protein